jgi:hypothetical protein
MRLNGSDGSGLCKAHQSISRTIWQNATSSAPFSDGATDGKTPRSHRMLRGRVGYFHMSVASLRKEASTRIIGAPITRARLAIEHRRCLPPRPSLRPPANPAPGSPLGTSPRIPERAQRRTRWLGGYRSSLLAARWSNTSCRPAPAVGPSLDRLPGDSLRGGPDQLGLPGTQLGRCYGRKACVLIVPGPYFQKSRPEVDQLNFVSHVKVPVLMLNGRFDFFHSVETSQEPMFRLLGTPNQDKRRVVYEPATTFHGMS